MKKSLLLLVFLFLFSCSKKEINDNGITYDFTLENFIENYDPDEIITNSILEKLDKQQLRIIRNSIFAKHGYIFKSSDLQDYFSKISWYNGTKANVDNELTEIDKLNIQNIISYENNPENKEAAPLVSVDSIPVVTQYGNSFNDLNVIAEYLRAVNASQENPISLKLNISLGTMTDTDSNWRRLLKILDDAGKYVALDLSSCPISGRDFNPISSVQTGKWFIVSLILPDVAKNIPNGTVRASMFNYFDNLKTLSAKEITTIGMNVFDACLNLNVSFPSITNIAENNFAGCTGLVSVNFPGVIDIGKGAFAGCISLSRVIFPTATTIGENAFQGCTSLIYVSFPKVVLISQDVFADCSSLSSVVFPTATTIGENAFQGCTSLTNVSFPKVVLIGQDVFADCTSLSSAVFPVTLTIGINAFKGCTNLAFISFPAATTICAGAFESCGNLINVSFPVVTTIEGSTSSPSTYGRYNGYGGAFQDCTSLKRVSFPATTIIGGSSFLYCTSLNDISFPVVITIGENAFQSCSSLTNIHFPSAIEIGRLAFADCTALASVNFPEARYFTQYFPYDPYGGRFGTLRYPYGYSTVFQNCNNLISVTLGEHYDYQYSFGLPDNLNNAYRERGAGTYTRSIESNSWTKK